MVATAIETEVARVPRDTFRIPRYALAGVEHEIGKFARKARALGLAPIRLETIGTEEVRIRKTRNEFSLSHDWFEIVEVVTVRLIGERPQLNGWTFVATLNPQHAEDGTFLGNLIGAVPGEECPVAYRDADAMVCAHCGTRRRRKATYVLRHEDGRYTQVGSSCIKDFLGGVSAETIATYAEALIGSLDRLRSLAGDEDDLMRRSGGRGETAWDLLGYLTVTSAAMREHGWTSAAAARDNHGLIPTRSRVTDHLTWVPTPREPKPPLNPEEGDKDRAAAALALATEHLAAKTDRSDYEHNLWLVCQRGVVTHKTAGVAASLINFAEKIGQERVERAARAERPASAHQGTVGKRQDFTLRVVAVREWSGFYGVTFFHRMVDAAGNVFVWKSSSDCLEIDTEYRIKGTVKEHGVYRDEKQTVLTRCAATEIAA